MRYLALFVISNVICVATFAQSVTAFHDVQPSGENNSYTIKTKISGLTGVDIARITYFIDNSHTYNASPNNSLFSDRNEKYIKFYIMAVPASGELNVELGVTLSGSGDFAFPVEFQYSKNEEKKSINFPQISISGEPLAVIEEAPVIEESPVAEETPIVEETPTVEEVAETETEEPEEENLEEKIRAEEQEQLAQQKAEEERKQQEYDEFIAIADAKFNDKDYDAAKSAYDSAIDIKPNESYPKEKIAEINAIESEIIAAESAKEVVVEEETEVIPEEEPVAEEPVVEVVETTMEETTPEPEPVVEETTVEIEEETPAETERVINTPAPSTSAKYSIQILSLAEFSQSRLNTYIRQHNLDASKIKKRQVGQWTKISYGELNSKDEAREMILKLRRSHNITDAFLVTLP